MLDYAMLLANAVHDMKNSLGLMLHTLEEMDQPCSGGCMSGGKRERLVFEAHRLNHDLLQLLAVYKINTEHYQPNIEEHEVSEFLDECVLNNESLLVSRGFRIERKCDPHLTGYFDRNMVAGVINNVVNNAYKYSKDRVCLSAQVQNGYLELAVADNGPGYPEKMLCTAVTAPSSVDFSIGSTSLGLYFASLIAAMHTDGDKHGYIECTNTGIDGGGRFTLFLP